MSTTPSPQTDYTLDINDRRTTDRGLSGRVVSIEERLDRNDKHLTANTLATNEVLEIVRMGKSFFKVLGLIGNLIKWGAVIGAAVISFYTAIKHSQS